MRHFFDVVDKDLAILPPLPEVTAISLVLSSHWVISDNLKERYVCLFIQSFIWLFIYLYIYFIQISPFFKSH